MLTCAKILLLLLDFQNLFWFFWGEGRQSGEQGSRNKKMNPSIILDWLFWKKIIIQFYFFLEDLQREEKHVFMKHTDYAFVEILWKSSKGKNKGPPDRNRARKSDRMRVILGKKP